MTAALILSAVLLYACCRALWSRANRIELTTSEQMRQQFSVIDRPPKVRYAKPDARWSA